MLIGVALVVAMQFAFTYAPFMQAVFHTEPVSLLDGLRIVGIGITLLLIVELEKHISPALVRWVTSPSRHQVPGRDRR